MKSNKPILIIYAIATMLLIYSCDSNSLNTNEKSQDEIAAENKKKELELQQKELELKERELKNKEEAIDEKKERMESVENAKRQMDFERASECVVVSPKAYFYSRADSHAKRKAYLVKGDRCNPIRVQNNFIYIEFFNNSSYKSTDGWICMDDIEIVY
jgi:hypothetical protein